jgi:signal transduction histidine kinase
VKSFRARIALWYAILVVLVVGGGAIAINVSFRQLLIEQARERIARTSDEIEQAANPRGIDALIIQGVPAAIIFSNQGDLNQWASATTLVQIDRLDHRVYGRSSNLGDADLGTGVELTPTRDRAVAIQNIPAANIGDVLVLDRVIYQADRPVAIAHVAEKLAIVETTLGRARQILIVVTLVALVIVVFASYLLARAAVEPIVELTAAMREIGSDRLDRRLAWTDRVDEVGTLAATFDAMLARLQEAFARERQFISDASHELKTPLTVINANAQMLARWADRDEVIRRESLAAIIDESSQLAQIVNGMLLLAKADSGDAIPKEPLVLDAVVADAVAHLQDRAERKSLALTYEESPEHSIVVGDANLLRQVVTNLTDNAIKFTERGSVEVRVVPNGNRVAIEVRDTGPGIDEAKAEQLFDRFFRGDASHTRTIEGTGLGLAIVRSIVRVHGGIVTAQARPEGGSLFRVELAREPTFTDDS